MKAKVLIPFFDKEAKVNRKPGETFDLSPARFNEITAKGRYIEACADTTVKTAVDQKK